MRLALWAKPFRQFSFTRCRRSGAFTILELMVAIGIFAMVLVAIYSIWMAILKGSQAGLKAAAVVQRSRIAMRTLEDAFLTVAFFTENYKYYAFVADTSGDLAAVSMVARLPASFPGVGRYGDQVVRRVSFYTRSGPDGLTELVMTQAPMLMVTNSSAEAYSLVLARDVTKFTLEFWDARENDWVDEWKWTNQLPKLVMISLGLGKKGGIGSDPQDEVMRIVALPAAAVTRDIHMPVAQPVGLGDTNLQQRFDLRRRDSLRDLRNR
jgi:type II secretory pathway pseudopilin PulG